eukprot:scaffold803_cov310-Pinguiococcus_pyrenoidosus.AAC.203
MYVSYGLGSGPCLPEWGSLAASSGDRGCPKFPEYRLVWSSTCECFCSPVSTGLTSQSHENHAQAPAR